MEPHRFLSAFVVWLQRQIPQTQEGQQQWTQTVKWLNEPPATVSAPLNRATAARMPRGAPPGAPVAPSAQASAFDAFMGSSGVGG